MDATQASATARSYFEAVSKAAPLGFSVDLAEQAGDEWRILCSLYDYFGASQRSAYEIIVDPDGSVKKVSKVGA